MAGLLVLYPLFVYWGVKEFSPRIVSVVLLLLFSIRFLFVRNSQYRRLALLGYGGIVILLVISAIFYPKANLFIPVVINLCLFFLFYNSLKNPASIIEIVAQKLEGELPEQAKKYCRKVTKIWSGFFLINASLALLTTFPANPKYWLMYNGLLSYVLIALLVLGELVTRRIYKHKYTSASPVK